TKADTCPPTHPQTLYNAYTQPADHHPVGQPAAAPNDPAEPDHHPTGRHAHPSHSTQQASTSTPLHSHQPSRNRRGPEPPELLTQTTKKAPPRPKRDGTNHPQLAAHPPHLFPSQRVNRTCRRHGSNSNCKPKPPDVITAKHSRQSRHGGVGAGAVHTLQNASSNTTTGAPDPARRSAN